MTPTELPSTRFGRDGPQVTRLCQGTAFRTLQRDPSDRRATAVLHHSLDRGVRFFDSSNAYGWGGSERLLGAALRGRRDDVVICTKVSPSDPPAADGTPGIHRPFTEAYLSEQLDGSRARLDTDVIDLYLLHSPDRVTPMAALCEAMQRLLDSGRIRHWGVSNHSAAQVEELCHIAGDEGLTPPVGVEDYYTIAGAALTDDGRSRTRQLENDMFPVLQSSGLGLLAFSPMDRGDLAPGRRLDARSLLVGLLEAVDAVAAELSTSRGAVCVAWVLAQSAVSVVLGGAESPDHVDEMIDGVRFELPAESLATLDAASRSYSQEIEG
jgi:aryl-alcohol dehydrogenase-like predicted oxidoreductase